MKLKFFVSGLLFFLSAVFTIQAATQCSTVFPDGVANSSVNGKIKFENSSKLINNPDSILASANVVNENSSISCQTQNVNCSAGGASSVVPSLTATYSGYSSSTNLTVQNGNVVTISNNNYKNVEVKSGSTLNMSTSFSTYRFKKLIVKETSIVNLTAGDYFFEELEIKSTSKLNVIGSGTVRVFVKNKVTFKESSTINGGVSGDPAKLFIYFFANGGNKLEIKSGATFAGYIYSKNKVEIKGGNTKVVGAISAAGELKLENGATVTYNGSALANADLGSVCNTTPTPATPIANYRLDECAYTGVANEVIDQLGTYNGRSFGALDTFAGGKIERAANLNAGGHRIEISVPLPSSFSVTTWFKKPTATNGNRYFILGSMAAAGDLLFLDRNNNWRWGVYNPVLGNKYGTFRFNSLDNNWHHLTLVYSGSLTKLYIDGVFTDSVGRVPSGTLKYIGTSYDQVNSANPQGFRAPLDEFIVFNSALTQADITTIYNNQAAGKNWDGSARTPVSCSSLLGLYKFEQTSFASSITDTSGFNHNGTNLGGSSIAAGKYCRGFDGNGSNSSSNTNNAFSSNIDLDGQVGLKGTISFWYKSNGAWNSGGYNGGERTLFDASKNIGQGVNNKYFQLGIESNGRLRFTFEDSNDGDYSLYEPSGTVRSSNTWYYLTVTWNYIADNYQLYVNGSLVTSASINTNGAMKDLGAIVFGDNSSTYVANNNFSLPSPYSANGQFDEVRIYRKVLTSTEIQTDMNDNGGCFNIDHYQIEHDGNGLTCMAETVTIKACANASCSNLSANSASVNFQVAGITQSSPSFTGSTSVSFNHLVAETVTLSLTNASPTPSNATICKNGASTSCDIVFSDAGFVLDVNNGANVESCTTPNLTIKAVKLSDNGVSCAPAFTGNQDLSFIFNYINPNSGSKLPQLNTTNLAAAGNSQTRTVNFNASGIASLPLTYADAGQLKFTVAEVTASGVSSGNITKTFYPNKLVVSASNSLPVPQPLNSVDSNGTNKQKAGVDFPINIAAQCANGITTPNYIPQSNSALELSVQQKAPTAFTGSLAINGGNTITATNTSTTTWNATNQSALNFTAKYSEVGIINIAAKDVNYFGAVVNAGGTPNYTNVGRFTPDHFIASITNGEFDNQCIGNFTYIGQPFSYDAFALPKITITAQNKANTITKNYTQTGYQKLIATNVSRTFALADNIKKGADNSTYMAVSRSYTDGALPLGNAGVMTYTFNSSDGFTYTKNANAKIAPFDVAAVGVSPAISQYKITIDSIADSDLIDASAFLTASPQTVIPAGLKLRFGRLFIDNAYGPETSNLPLPITTQYWDGSNYVANTLDSCTSFNADLTANYTLTNTGLNPALPTNVNTSSGSGNFASGVAEILLSKPTNNAQGQIRYTYDATPAWLLDDWDGDGNFDNKPSAVASFGIFRGNDRIIYWREIHQ